MITRIELNARLSSQHFQGAAGFGMGCASRKRRSRTAAIQHEVVVVTYTEPELFVIPVDPVSDPPWPGEIERRSLYGPQLARRNQVRIHGREAIGGNGHDVVQNVP